jgi:RES domain-containing protein
MERVSVVDGDLARDLGRPFHANVWACRDDRLPAQSAMDLVSDRPNRWNAEGEPTIYLSGDAALALVESGRHPDDLAARSRLIEVDLRLAMAIDLRDPDVGGALELPAEPTWILDRGQTRCIALSLRRSGWCEGLIVPSAGTLDQRERWNAVVFADDPTSVGRAVGTPSDVGVVILDAVAAGSDTRDSSRTATIG